MTQFQLASKFTPRKVHCDFEQSTVILIGETGNLIENRIIEEIYFVKTSITNGMSHIIGKFSIGNDEGILGLLQNLSPKFLSITSSPEKTFLTMKSPSGLVTIDFEVTKFKITPTTEGRFLGIYFSKPVANVYSVEGDSLQLDLTDRKSVV